MRCTVKDWPFGLSYDDFEERLEEMGLDWPEERKLRFWKNLCSYNDLEFCYQAMTEAIIESEEEEE